ncbi:MAG: hypothetical protein HRU06_17190 [Oceanospirillaceae bacterium]|nr:hypothetical protein [Oceanospirillaceae bacterium]
MPAIKIEAFTFEYNQLQDRICLGGNLYNDKAEISFWLTRRLVLRLLTAAVELVQKTSPKITNTPQEHKLAMAQFEHQCAQQKGSSNVEKTAPLSGSNVQPINANILHRMDISCKDQRYKVSFFVVDTEEAVAISYLDSGQFHQVLSFIHSGALELEWGVEADLFASDDAQQQYTLQ